MPMRLKTDKLSLVVILMFLRIAWMELDGWHRANMWNEGWLTMQGLLRSSIGHNEGERYFI